MAARCVLILLLSVCGVVPGAAQGGVGFGPLVGVYRGRDGDGYRVLGGAVLRFRLSEVIGLEGSFNYRGEKYNHGSVDVKSWPLMVTALFYPITFVYGGVGAGWYNSSVSYNAPPGVPGGVTAVSRETKQQFGWHYGGGVELTVFSFLKLVGDIRYVVLNNSFKSTPGSNGVSSGSPVMTAGLVFSL